jgi:signal recognition particle subunit SRP54
MLDNLTARLTKTIQNLRGLGRVTEDNIKETLQDIRQALLEADVALPVVKQFIEKIRTRAIGQDVMQSLTPGQVVVKIVHDELVTILGETNAEINLKTQPPAVILMAGLQGSGKTTTAAKLARWLKEELNKSVLLVSTDVYRPAAIKQLETLANEISVPCFPSQTSEKPVDIALAALASARSQFLDVLIVDTAGRLHIDDEMMQEIKQIHAAIEPIETLFVVDSMTGQDAAKTAHAFDAALPISGVILTKMDGDARGGAALSIRTLTGKPIKWIGMGEKTTALQAFYPDRLASRILGMGDILSLVEDAHRHFDKKEAEKLANKIKKGKGFDLEDFRDQLRQLRKMGGVANLLDKLPNMGGMLPGNMKQMMNDEKFIKIEAIINSMTSQERRFPDLIRGSRKRRIANGSGTQVQDVNQLLKQYLTMQKTMKQFSKNKNMLKMMQNMPQ